MRAAAGIVALAMAAALAAGAVDSRTAAPPTAYLVPLQTHQANLGKLRREIDRLRRLPAPATASDAKERAQEIRQAGMAYLTEARAFAKTVGGYVKGGTRRGLDSEVAIIRASIAHVLATVDAYRVLAGATIEKPDARTPSVLERTLRDALGMHLARRIPNKLVAEGVRRMLAGESFQVVLREALDQAGRQAYASVDRQVRRVTGLGLRDLRDMRRAIRLRANQEVDRLFERLLLRSTGSGLVIELARTFVLPWLKAQLTQLMRPRRTLDERVTISIRSLERATTSLNALSPDARLTTVHARWQEASAALAATRFLVAEIKRAHREALLSSHYGEALTAVERARRLTETRFLLHKEDLVQTLAADQSELHGLLGDLGDLVGHVLVPATGGAVSLDDELLSRGGRWTFGRVKGPVLCEITLTKKPGKYGAKVMRACHPNESFWKLEGRVLVFLHSDGTRTSTLTRKNAEYWQGPYLGTPALPRDGTIHYIRR